MKRTGIQRKPGSELTRCAMPQRIKPMKNVPIERGDVPLRRRKRLAPGDKPPARKTELPKVNQARQARKAASISEASKTGRTSPKRPENYVPKGRGVKAVMGRSEDWCEVRRPGVCISLRGHSTHHRLDQSLDGTGWRPANLLRTCGDGSRGCHGWITENPKQAHDEGRWALESNEKPEETPVLIVSPQWPGERRWVLLDDKGGVTPTTAPRKAAA